MAKAARRKEQIPQILLGCPGSSAAMESAASHQLLARPCEVRFNLWLCGLQEYAHHLQQHNPHTLDNSQQSCDQVRADGEGLAFGVFGIIGPL